MGCLDEDTSLTGGILHSVGHWESLQRNASCWLWSGGWQNPQKVTCSTGCCTILSGNRTIQGISGTFTLSFHRKSPLTSAPSIHDVKGTGSPPASLPSPTCTSFSEELGAACSQSEAVFFVCCFSTVRIQVELTGRRNDISAHCYSGTKMALPGQPLA